MLRNAHGTENHADVAAGLMSMAQLMHDQGLDDYRRRATSFLTRLDPENPVNVAAYTQALARIVARGEAV